jgi:uncharacterized protein (TIGR03437 family)
MYVRKSGIRLDKKARSLLALPLALLLLVYSAPAQQNRITTPIDNRQRVTLTGHLHPKARPENDQGRVSPGMTLSYVTLTLSQTAAQKADLEQLLKQQQTPGSPNYHRWLTPEQYAQRFGASDADLATITTWLKGQGLTVAAVARGHNWVAVNGTAAQFESVFQTEFHNYLGADGETHFANATQPSVPAALDGVIMSIRGLNDFRMKPARRPRVKPLFDSSHGAHYLAPDDIATIYDIAPLFSAGINGSGQTLVIAGQTQVNLSDIETFRSSYNLPANDPQLLLVPGTRNPGISSNDLPEADLDLEWSGAVARNANIIFVYTEDVMNSVEYAIDQNLAPIVSVSYGSCELETPNSELTTFQSWALQANSQGITWFAASGDAGGADCDDTQNPGLSVDAPGSVPQVTSVGGTEFAEGSGTFWATTNTANSASALSYIPEVAWNDSALDGDPSATGGGASIFFSKPSWQVGPGVPTDNARHVPDIALSASADHDGYLVYSGGSLQIFGGTSVPTPTFAGITALLNQYLVSQGGNAGVGNLNSSLYSLAQTNPGIFHDITVGNNIVTVNCARRDPSCGTLPVGYSAGPGYDQTTGLGSVDVNKLVTEFSGISGTPPVSSTSLTLSSNVTTLASTDVMYLVATITNPSGITPTGSVTFNVDTAVLGSAELVGSAGTARATLVVTGSQLPPGSGTITAEYSGNSSASLNVSVTGTSSGVTPSIAALTNGASYQQAFSPGGIVTIFGSQLAISTESAGSIPLPITASGVAVLVNGVPAPLYYSSASQINAQIPYETAVGGATLTVNNNGKITSQNLTITAAAPGIFINANSFLTPTSSASRGQEIILYVTGVGAVSPALATGYAPTTTVISQLPQPLQKPTVTVGGQPATIDFAGIPTGLVGVMQINFVVPTGVGLGNQSVVVSEGGFNSGTALLNITN